MSNQLKIYEVPVQWKLFSTMTFEAESEEDALEMAYEAPLPVGVYLDDSFEVFDDEVEVVEGKTKKEIIEAEISNYILDMQNNIFEIKKMIKDNPDLNLNYSDYLDLINDIIYKE
jgi:hypothetical protein